MMVKRSVHALAIALFAILGTAPAVWAQEVAGQQPVTEQQLKERAALEEKALALLEQVISEAQLLKLPENRVRIQIGAGDLLWDRNEARARAIFAQAAANIVEMLRNINGTDRQYFGLIRLPSQLRQELLLTVARHDSAMAYQLLQTTRPPPPPASARSGGPPDMEASVEQNLLAQIAATDPTLALRNAEEMLDKGQYSSALAKVQAQLQSKDKEAAAKFGEKLLKRLQSENLLVNREAGNLALNLLQPGPIPGETAASGTKPDPDKPSQPLSASAFRDLLETVIAAALKATPGTSGNSRVPNDPRGAQNAPGGTQNSGRGQGQNNPPGGQNNRRAPGQNNAGGNSPNNAQNSAAASPTSAQIEQNNARGLLMGLQALLPQIDQYLPGRAPAVRQKLTEIGVGNDPRRAFSQFGSLAQQATVESMLQAAAGAPAGMQSRLYQQAALKAAAEGDTDRAREIANKYLDSTTRTAVLQSVDIQQAARGSSAEKMEEVRQSISRLRSEEERVRLLLQLAAATQKENPKLALQVLDEAKNLVVRRAAGYQQFDAQLKVAHAFAALETARSFETLEPGIMQLNELLSAAALLSGFEVDIFKEGELPLQGGSSLTSMVLRYAQELAGLAKIDFEGAQTAADKFQLAEPRILARLSIVRGVLGVQPVQSPGFGFGGRDFGPNMPFMRRPQ